MSAGNDYFVICGVGEVTIAKRYVKVWNPELIMKQEQAGELGFTMDSLYRMYMIGGFVVILEILKLIESTFNFIDNSVAQILLKNGCNIVIRNQYVLYEYFDTNLRAKYVSSSYSVSFNNL